MTHQLSGWSRQPKDKRDYKFARRITKKDYPAKTQNYFFLTARENQGDLGACTGNAIANAMEYLKKRFGKIINFSRLFVYYNERVIEGTVNEDSGAIVRDGIKSIATLGACEERLCKYNIAKFTKKPSPTAFKRALSYRIKSYYALKNADDIISALAEGLPVVFGFNVYESFESDAVAATGDMPMPKAGEKVLGGHCVWIVDYEDLVVDVNGNIVRFTAVCVNSWGADWGDKGLFRMPSKFLLDPKECDDFWAFTFV